MTYPDLNDLSRHERADIVLRADLRGRLPTIEEGGASRSASPVVAKAILFVLDSFPPDRCFPSEAYIARQACTTERTLRRTLASLIAAGYVEARPRAAKGRRYHSSRIYRVRYDLLGALDHRTLDLEVDRPAPAQWAGPGQPRPNGSASPGPLGAQPRPHGPTTHNNDSENVDHSISAAAATATAPPAANLDARGRALADLEVARWTADITPALIRIGVARRRIPTICRQAGSRERILEVLELLRDRIKRKDDVRNPGGWIARAIADGWTAETTTEGARP